MILVLTIVNSSSIFRVQILEDIVETNNSDQIYLQQIEKFRTAQLFFHELIKFNLYRQTPVKMDFKFSIVGYEEFYRIYDSLRKHLTMRRFTH